MSSGGKRGGSSSATVGYRYLMGVHIAVSHGPVDSVNRILIGEREAWSGSVTSNATINVNKPSLFGGDNREGGVAGNIDIMMGSPTQGRNGYLTPYQGASAPAYRGLLTVLFKSFMWSSGNPYFKSPWVEVTRVLAGWKGGVAWNAADAAIGTLDMNPAHIIYQCLTDNAWGMGYNASDIDTVRFAAVASQLKSEGFGLSLPWDQQSTIEDFIKVILNHINGALALDLTTGKFALRLIRDDYSIGSLLELNESNVLELKSFQRAAIGDGANEVVVTYTDREGNDKPIAVQNLAMIEAQGGVISVSKPYPGIREPELAARVAMRDLATLSANLAQVSLVCNRDMWDKEIGDVVKLSWGDLGLIGVPFRIIDIPKGTLTDSKITVSLVEDIFGLPLSAYATTTPTQWIDNVVPPIAADAGFAVEAPYWDVVKNVSLADQAQLVEGYGFGTFMAARGAVQSLLNYTLSASADDIEYEDVATGHFSPTGLLVAPLTPTQTSFSLSGAFDLDAVTLSSEGGYAYIGNECVAVVSIDPSTGAVVVARGCLDTVPVSHSTGTRVFFVTSAVAYDSTERVAGEVVYYRPRPTTGLGSLALADADTETLTLSNRASRPYPPGNFMIAGSSYPVTIPGPEISVSWSHRDRIAQTVSLVDHTTGNIGPEPGVSYRVRVWNGITLLRTYEVDGTATSWSYPSADDTADGNLTTLTIGVSSVRDGLESLQAASRAFSRLTGVGGVFVDGPPATPTLTASGLAFGINVAWAFGDGRTNIESIEIRVANEPDITHSTVLEYVDYPATDHLHEIGTLRAYRWYWVRVLSTEGLLSAWSNMASARADVSASDPTVMLAEINTLLTDGSGTNKIEMLSDRFTIKSPDGTKTPFAVVDVGGGVYKTLLNSDVLIGGDVSIANLTTGSLPSDVTLSLGGGTIELDGSGEIRVFKDLGLNADFVRLSSGEIRFLRYISGAYQTYNYLSRLETGVANSGDVVTIPGYWKAQPRVMVSPAILSLYKKAYAAQDQAIACTALNLVETTPGSGVWQFNATATLNLAAMSGGGALNLTSGVTAVNTHTSPAQTTPNNCTQITPSVNLTSVRGNGVSQYYRRTVRWRVEYYNAGAWVTTAAWRNVLIGDQLGAIVDSVVFNFPSSAAWQWRIYFESFDTNGTVFGSISYAYSQSTVTSPDNIDTTWQVIYSTGDAAPLFYGKAKRSAYSVPGGTGEIYQITYNATASANVKVPSGSHYGSMKLGLGKACTGGLHHDVHYDGAQRDVSTALLATNVIYQDVYLYSGDFVGQTFNMGAKSVTVAGSNLTFNPGYWSVATEKNRSASYWLNAKLSLTGMSATVYRRTAVVNSTTPANTFALDGYTYNLTSAQVLATGSINWMAVGE